MEDMIARLEHSQDFPILPESVIAENGRLKVDEANGAARLAFP